MGKGGRKMCLAQGPQRSDAGEARTHGPSVLSTCVIVIPAYFTYLKTKAN